MEVKADLKNLRSEMIALRLEPSLKKKILKKCKELNMSPSEFIRNILDAAFNHTPEVLTEIVKESQRMNELLKSAIENVGEQIALYNDQKEKYKYMKALNLAKSTIELSRVVKQ